MLSSPNVFCRDVNEHFFATLFNDVRDVLQRLPDLFIERRPTTGPILVYSDDASEGVLPAPLPPPSEAPVELETGDAVDCDGVAVVAMTPLSDSTVCLVDPSSSTCSPLATSTSFSARPSEGGSLTHRTVSYAEALHSDMASPPPPPLQPQRVKEDYDGIHPHTESENDPSSKADAVRDLVGLDPNSPTYHK
jgi:hypothetical protein